MGLIKREITSRRFAQDLYVALMERVYVTKTELYSSIINVSEYSILHDSIPSAQFYITCYGILLTLLDSNVFCKLGENSFDKQNPPSDVYDYVSIPVNLSTAFKNGKYPKLPTKGQVLKAEQYQDLVDFFCDNINQMNCVKQNLQKQQFFDIVGLKLECEEFSTPGTYYQPTNTTTGIDVTVGSDLKSTNTPSQFSKTDVIYNPISYALSWTNKCFTELKKSGYDRIRMGLSGEQQNPAALSAKVDSAEGDIIQNPLYDFSVYSMVNLTRYTGTDYDYDDNIYDYYVICVYTSEWRSYAKFCYRDQYILKDGAFVGADAVVPKRNAYILNYTGLPLQIFVISHKPGEGDETFPQLPDTKPQKPQPDQNGNTPQYDPNWIGDFNVTCDQYYDHTNNTVQVAGSDYYKLYNIYNFEEGFTQPKVEVLQDFFKSAFSQEYMPEVELIPLKGFQPIKGEDVDWDDIESKLEKQQYHLSRGIILDTSKAFLKYKFTI